jgi:hypothetical protein
VSVLQAQAPDLRHALWKCLLPSFVGKGKRLQRKLPRLLPVGALLVAPLVASWQMRGGLLLLRPMVAPLPALRQALAERPRLRRWFRLCWRPAPLRASLLRMHQRGGKSSPTARSGAGLLNVRRRRCLDVRSRRIW